MERVARKGRLRKPLKRQRPRDFLRRDLQSAGFEVQGQGEREIL